MGIFAYQWSRKIAWVLVVCAVLCGCAASPVKSRGGQHAWGEHATLLPSWQRLGRAATKAARDPNTWAPAVGAVVFSATDWDNSVSDWAQRHHPVFGSHHDALRARDDFHDAAKYGAIVTALLTPNGADRTTAVAGKLKGMGLQMGAYYATENVAIALKRGVARRRPNESNNRSFPSSHSSTAFASSTLGRRNVAVSGFSPTTSRVLDVGFVSLGVVTSWAQVEAGVHYPSDVLTGAALGYFIAAVVNDAFIGEQQGRAPRLSLQLGREMGKVGFVWPLY